MANKLPRRTMSMAKRGVKRAEELADLDLVEGAIGNPETDGPDGGPRFSHPQLILGWTLGLVMVVAFMFLGKALFASANRDYSMLPDGYREATGLTSDEPAELTGYEGNGRSTLPSAARVDSPWAEPVAEVPIVLKVACPDGTVHIATGPNEADAVCIRGRLVTEPVATPTAQEMATSTTTPTATIIRPMPSGLPVTGEGES
ncbi:hypothetical protein LCGC14_2795030 [marine sediment metagenome]|uniref:Uncharacterized protein n=1 Tax=marine sediment metagenome TaxID=412755 RepID=A0A0F8YPB5_9ZZZZ